MPDSEEIAVFNDLVEGARILTIEVVVGMIQLRINASRPVAQDGTFLLDSEEIGLFHDALISARVKIHGK
jgi:hypothetical protein